MPGYVQGVNPTIIEWARERSGYTQKEVAEFLNKNIETICNWESGECAPTYAQLEKLAHKFKRPIALFFFPEAPQEPELGDQFSLRSSEIEKLNPRLHVLLRQAAARQISLMELNMDVNPVDTKIFRDLHVQVGVPITDLARRAREYLSVSIETQANWKNSTEAFEYWRDCIQEKGILVFKDAFQDDFVDGFSLVHEQFPVIYLNNSRPHARQIFSLFHELAHLLLQRNGITRGVKIGGVQIERFCNRFAAEFLVPSADLETRLNFQDYDDTAIWELASYYNVSRPVILLKLIDRHLLKPAEYRRKAKKWKDVHESTLEKEAESKKSGGGDYYNTRAAYLGFRYLELAFSKYHQGGCSIEELAEHLNVKVKMCLGWKTVC